MKDKAKIELFFESHQTFKGFIIGFLLSLVIFWFINSCKYNINQESETITATIDRYPYIYSKFLNYDGDFDIEGYVNGKYNHLDLTKFVEDFFESMLDDERICKISNKFFLQGKMYYHVCDETALFEPTENDIIIGNN